jgi:hypothetical protein
MNENLNKTLKSVETEDWLDLHVVRPFCYYWAVLFAKLDIHPNTVTILSMIIGAISAIFFGCASFYYSGTWGLMMNIIAILLLCLADIFDCTDGQLARMTGKKSRLGRILDGVAGFAWFIPIYHAMVYRFYLHHDLEFEFLGIDNTPENALIATGVAYALGLIGGIMGTGGQQRLADYYIQIHLFFLKGEKGAELDNSKRQQEIYDQMTDETPAVERYFQKTYIDYTKKQEASTPQFQRLMQKIREKFGTSDNMQESVRQEFHDASLPVIKWNGLLTFNFRSFWLFLFCLLDVPIMYFVWEIVGMGLLYTYVRHRHESFCKRIADKL